MTTGEAAEYIQKRYGRHPGILRIVADRIAWRWRMLAFDYHLCRETLHEGRASSIISALKLNPQRAILFEFPFSGFTEPKS
jgi:hypothetical protein